MLPITQASARQWSRLGPRAMFGQAILALAEKRDDLLVLSADLGASSGLDRFRKAHPQKFLNTGVAEQNMIGVAAGLAKEGFVVFATSFAPFVALRAGEQVRMNLGYMQLNVKAVALGSGLAMGFLGNSHFGLEDAAVMRSIAGLTVVCPADCAEIVKTVEAAAAFKGPMFIRLTGVPGMPVVYEQDYEFEIGRAIRLKDGSDVCIIASGSMVAESLIAANQLAALGISARVVNMHTLKPLDTVAIDEAIAARLIVTVEEHSVIGGLGSAVAEYKTTLRSAPPQLLIGLPDAFGVTADYRYLLQKYGLVGDAIAARIQSALLALEG
jgi:transketolase